MKVLSSSDYSYSTLLRQITSYVDLEFSSIQRPNAEHRNGIKVSFLSLSTYYIGIVLQYQLASDSPFCGEDMRATSLKIFFPALLCLLPANSLSIAGSAARHSTSGIQEVRSLRTITAARAIRRELAVQARTNRGGMEVDTATLGLRMAPQVSVVG